MIPLSTISAASSGTVSSTAAETASMMAPTGAARLYDSSRSVIDDLLREAVAQIAALDRDGPAIALGQAGRADRVLDPLGGLGADQ
jgi:hypothetical protein